MKQTLSRDGCLYGQFVVDFLMVKITDFIHLLIVLGRFADSCSCTFDFFPLSALYRVIHHFFVAVVLLVESSVGVCFIIVLLFYYLAAWQNRIFVVRLYCHVQRK